MTSTFLRPDSSPSPRFRFRPPPPRIDRASTGRACLTGLLVLLSASALAQGGAPSAAAQAAGARVMEHRVRSGDTLSAIVIERLDSAFGTRDLAEFNRLPNPDRLRPEQLIRIPMRWLKPIAVAATVERVGGEAVADGRVLRVGDTVDEGARVETTPGAVVVLRLPDGSRLRLEPASRIRLQRLRQYHDEQTVDAVISLDQGRVQPMAQPGRTRPFSIRTPFATAAVRGTDFRVSAAADWVTTEVLSGGVSWGEDRPVRSAEAATRVDAGQGSTADPSRQVSAPVPLLPAPRLADWPSSIDTIAWRLSFPPVEGARAYRVEIAADPAFERIRRSQVIDRPEVAYQSDADGDHHVRIRAIDAARLEGFDATARLEVRARPTAPQPRTQAPLEVSFGTTHVVQWSTVPEARAYRLQVAADPGFQSIVLDRVLEEPRATIDRAGVRSGRLHWRVASVGPERRAGPFGSARVFDWRESPSPARASATWDRTELEWAVPAGVSSRIRVRWAGPAGAAERIESLPARPEPGTVRVTIRDLPAGEATAQVQWIHPDGVQTPWSAENRWTTPSVIRMQDGSPLGSGAGGVVGTTGP